MKARTKDRKNYAVWAIALFITELLIAIYLKGGFIRHWVGDYLVVALLYCALQTVLPGKVIKRLVVIGLIALTIELLQAVGMLAILGYMDNTALKLIFGTTFSWTDLLAYALGLISIYGLEKLMRSRSFVECCEILLGSRKQS